MVKIETYSDTIIKKIMNTTCSLIGAYIILGTANLLVICLISISHYNYKQHKSFTHFVQ